MDGSLQRRPGAGPDGSRHRVLKLYASSVAAVKHGLIGGKAVSC